MSVESYPIFEFQMATDFPDYGWEALKVTTADDYILTMFHVWNPEKLDKSKQPILFQHGATGSATLWPTLIDPIPFYMADLGYDIYLGNNRGTDYS